MDKGSDANAKSELRSIHDACVAHAGAASSVEQSEQRTDYAYRSKFESTSTVRLRLGKAHWHIQAASRWEICPDVLHVLSPEIRVAMRILRPVVVEFLADAKGIQ